MPTIHAIIPAAGRSTRMGQPKQLMGIGGRPMLLAVIEPAVQCDRVAGVTVVTNSLVASSLDIVGAGVSVILNDEPDAQMIDSVRLGIAAIQHDHELNVDDGILICPGDQPGLTVDDVSRCCDAFFEQPSRIVVAAHDGQRGHPLIFPASRIPFVMSQACDRGLRELVEAHAELIRLVECTNSAVLRNVNTPEDFKRMRNA
jgi:molybdenum cofactor cytidylyltransferase